MKTITDEVGNTYVFSNSGALLAVRWYWSEIDDFRVTKITKPFKSLNLGIHYKASLDALGTLGVAVWMLLGGNTKFPNQAYLVGFKHGKFRSLSTGTSVSPSNALQPIWNSR